MNSCYLSSYQSGAESNQQGIQTEPLKLTEPEMNAALQLIQFSGDSGSSRDNIYHTAGDSTSRVVIVEREEESVGDTAEVSSSTGVNMEETFDEASPPKKRKFRSITTLYQVTKPMILNNKHRKFKSRN
ncbi:hypothetical protein RND71_041429 [Anisodus tanguticus]|uniref:Uncharacterized protein n=1 Tax=Anisodus tanguticus TaxID=243964 RepID=A0AAE1UR52_9SOLA|nr:hypothetical protein RND71_041429 [Anisodus tanguticus]